MQKKLIGLISYLISLGALADFPDIDKALYHPLKNIKDISFEMEAAELTKLVNAKLLLKTDPNSIWKVYKYKDQENIDFSSLENVSEKVIKIIEKGYLSKASFAWLDSVKNFLKDFQFVKRDGEIYYFEDIEGKTGIEELRLSFSRGQLEVEMDLIDQLEKHIYSYDRKPWSDSKLVLTSVVSQIKKVSQVTEARTMIQYKKVSKGLWLPDKIDVVTTQKSEAKTVGKVERSLSETYHFKKYKIDKKIAFEWFNSHNN